MESTVEISLEDAFHGGKRQIRVASLGQNFDVEVPKGIRSGQTIRLAGAAGGQDLYLNVQVAPHRLFERHDADLTVEVPITIAEAVLGGEIEVPTLEGTVTMTVPSETQTGRRFRLKGLGMPHARGAGRGDLFVRVRVVTPTGLTEQERTLFEELRRLRAENPRQTLMS
jgi:curved DNA-binding protein